MAVVFEHFLSSGERRLGNHQAWRLLESLTCTPVSCSTSWAVRPTGSWYRSLSEFMMTPGRWNSMLNVYEFHKHFALPSETQGLTWPWQPLKASKQMQKKAWKFLAWTGFWRQMGAVLQQFSFEAKWELVTRWVHDNHRKRKVMHNIHIQIYFNCGMKAKGSTRSPRCLNAI